MIVRLATREDLPEITRLMHASISALSRGFYDERQIAAAVRYIGVPDGHEDAARRAGFTKFELMATLPGVPLYERCGYAAVERAEIELPDGVRLGVVLMRK